MTKLESIDRIKALARRAEVSLRSLPDFPSVEPLFDEVLGIMEQSTLRNEFSELLINMSQASEFPIELIEYCAHALRWTELESGFKKLRDETKDRRLREAVDRILGAFEDDWDLRDIYKRWSPPPPAEKLQS
ncbi:MAG: hypothetical protein IPJ65_23925 [Archangiaceae bacterium]|nr:hypothetical protein [Archangiaceae bacterium]